MTLRSGEPSREAAPGTLGWGQWEAVIGRRHKSNRQGTNDSSSKHTISLLSTGNAGFLLKEAPNYPETFSHMADDLPSIPLSQEAPLVQRLAVRDVPSDDSWDVIVIGGGHIWPATAAAREGRGRS